MLLFLLQTEPSTAFLRAARAGHLDKVLELLDAGVDINSCNAVSLSNTNHPHLFTCFSSPLTNLIFPPATKLLGSTVSGC